MLDKKIFADKNKNQKIAKKLPLNPTNKQKARLSNQRDMEAYYPTAESIQKRKIKTSAYKNNQKKQHFNNPSEIDIIKSYNLPELFFKQMKPEWFITNKIFPFALKEGVLYVAVINHAQIQEVDNLRIGLNNPQIKEIVSVTMAEEQITNAIQDILFRNEQNVTEILQASHDELIPQNSTLDYYDLNNGEEATIPKLVNSIFAQAVVERASDIHFEPEGEKMVIRFRIDGVLKKVHVSPTMNIQAIINRIKIMAGLNIAEDRLPQDGKIQIKKGREFIDIRVATFPKKTQDSKKSGEHITLRLLSKSNLGLSLESLGMDTTMQRKFKDIVTKNAGIVLITGPTGSGKSSTLYSAIQLRNEEGVNIMTIEDPVEYQIAGITQMQVNPKINLTFASGLRAALRNDPDIIMVGEIRDQETAQTAIHSAQTGHLVLSTLHTNDAAGGVTRLIDMGIEGFLINSSVNGFMAQRLVREVCPHCQEEYTASADDVATISSLLGHELKPKNKTKEIKLTKGNGCEHCANTGYLGRTGIFEILTISPEIKKLILKNADSSEIKAQAIKEGMVTLQEDAINKLLAGKTTLAEIVRVIK